MGRDFLVLDWIVTPDLNRIRSGNESIQLEPKIMRVLVQLANSAGEVVTREALFGSVWEGTFVSDDVLTRSIVELRKTFGDDSRNPRIIETIPKKGYRLIPAVVYESPSQVLPASPAMMTRGGLDSWTKRAVGLAILFVSAVGSLALYDYFRPNYYSEPTSPRVVPLASSAGNEYDPAVSPDGNQVAFTWIREGEENEDIYIKQLGSEASLRLTTHPAPDRNPRWSPDRQRIAFVRDEGEECHILVVPSMGGPERKLTPCGNSRYPGISWSPDGEWIALARSESSEHSPLRLELMSVKTLAGRTLTLPPETYFGDHSSSFSPDGRQLAFIRSRTPGIEDVHVISSDGDGGEPRRITFDNRDITGLDWSPDGGSVVISSNRAGTYSLWRVPMSGGEPQWVTGGGMKLKHPTTARQKDLLAYENWIYEINIWQVELSGMATGEETGRLITSTQWDLQPQYSPDGKQIAFVSTRSGSSEIWKSSQDGSNLVQVTSMDGPHTSLPRWSPDGENLVFVSRPEGQADLYFVDASGAPPRQLTSHPLDEMAPSWSSDGRWIYFGSRRSGRWEIWKVEVRGGEPLQVTSNGGYAALESHDGSSLFYIKSDEPGIWKLSRECGDETLLVEGVSPEVWGSWALGKTGLVFARGTESGAEMILYDFDSEATSIVASVTNFIDAGLALAPGEGQILYSRVDRFECDVMLGEGLLGGASGY